MAIAMPLLPSTETAHRQGKQNKIVSFYSLMIIFLCKFKPWYNTSANPIWKHSLQETSQNAQLTLSSSWVVEGLNYSAKMANL